jgi:hypothetical protein
MKNNIKILLLALGILILILFFYLVFFSTKNSSPTAPATNNSNTGTGNATNPTNSSSNTPGNFPASFTPPAFSLPEKDDSKMTITTPGGNVDTNNIYKKPIETLPDNAVAFIENSDSHISFYPKNQGFLITIINPDIEAARQKAESDFLNSLGITKDQACQLTVDLGMPAWVNSEAAGRNYGLSFCSNGIPFPKQ